MKKIERRKKNESDIKFKSKLFVNERKKYLRKSKRNMPHQMK